MKIDLTKEQCKSLIDFIETNFLDEIRNDMYVCSLEWVQNILTAMDAFRKAVDYDAE